MSHHWIAVTESAFPWEMAALRYLRERLPEQEPFRTWANFEFVADDGSINAVDLLVVSLYKIYLVEIKSRPGCVSGDTSTWTWTHEGHTSTDDNPLLLANRKAKKLKALLQRQRALHGQRLPYVEPIIFLSAPGLRCDLSGAACTGVYMRQESERHGYPDIVAVLSGTAEISRGRHGAPMLPIDRRLSQAISRAIDQAGIRPSQRAHRVSDYRLERLLGETAAYQDWQATHVRFPRITRRVRIYPQALQSTELSRSMRRQAAEREFRLLEGINHAGILKALDLHEHERGPALIFEHDPEAQRLDWFLRDRGETLDIDTRLILVRQIAEALQYAHEHPVPREHTGVSLTAHLPNNYKRQSVRTLRHHLGFALHKARFGSDHRDEARRHAWLRDEWPYIRRAATRCQGLILFADETSCEPWGSLISTWAREAISPRAPQ